MNKKLIKTKKNNMKIVEWDVYDFGDGNCVFTIYNYHKDDSFNYFQLAQDYI